MPVSLRLPPHWLTLRESKAEKPLDWFPAPSRSFALADLHHLHLTGLTYSPAFFHSLKAPRLTSLTLEDYDTPSGEPLLASLREKGLFEGLQKLRVAEFYGGWLASREGGD